eukprot:XP_028355522.1 major centromere autoantigen B isoform X1 [Physeter catodon]
MGPKRRQLTFREKSRIIQEVEENPDLRKGEIARRFNIPPSTLSTILKNKRAILASERKYGVASTCRKTNKLSPYDKLEGLLIAWFQQIRAAGLPVKGIILKEKALRIAEELGMDDFTASNGWLDRFRRRHGVVSCSGVARARSRSAAPRPPAAPASPPTVPSEGSGGGTTGWRAREEQPPSVAEGYASQDVFSATETSLWYDFLPDQAAGLCGSDGRARKATQRLSVLLCANADGSEKLPPLVAGKSAKPRAGQAGLPCDYTANSKGGVTTQALAKYLKALDTRMAAESRRVLLLAGRLAAQSLDTSGLRHVQLAFFPPGTVQPLERGVVQQVKGHYRQAMLLKAMAALEGQDRSGLQLGLMEALHFVAAAWQAVEPSDIATCFREAGFGGGPNATITTALKSEEEEEEEEEEEKEEEEEEEEGEGEEEEEDGEEEEEAGEGEELGEEEEVEEEGDVDDSDEEEEEEEESSSEGLEAEDWAQGVVEAGGSFGGYGAQEEVQCPTLHFLEGEEDSESDSEEEEEDDEEDEDDEDDDEDGDEVPVPSFGEAMAYFAMVKRYLTSFPIDDRVQSHILHLEHDLVHVTRKNHARQAGVRGLGHQS